MLSLTDLIAERQCSIMTQIEANGIFIEYEWHGPEKSPVVLFVRGLGSQLVAWPEELIRGLNDAGFRVLLMDNRDAGLSQWFGSAGVPSIEAAFAAGYADEKAEVPYFLEDMAEDCVGLLDALDIEKAHVLGISMGGMIVQVLGAGHADRFNSLIPIMTTSGGSGIENPPPSEETLPFPDASADKEIIANAIHSQHAQSGSIYPMPEKLAEAIATTSFFRAFNPDGVTRQMAAIGASADRRELIDTIDLPTCVIQGSEDPHFSIEAAKDIADRIKGAEFHVIDGMGHNIPPDLAVKWLEIILPFLNSAEARPSS